MILVNTFQEANIKLCKSDCLDLLVTLEDNSIDLIATDPPYFKVKGDAWDNQWKNKEDFFTWLDSVLIELHRVLKPTGSLYLFAGPHLANEVEQAVAKCFNVLNQIIWRKPSGRHSGCNKESLRRFFPQTEHIIFAESKKPIDFPFESVRSYLDNARRDANKTRKDVESTCGCQMSSHWFGRSQFSIPSEEHYNTMDKLFGNTLKPYEELKAEFVALRDGFNRSRRTFNVTKDVPFTNVWDFKPVQPYAGKHPCEKPLDLMSHIIKTSSLPGDVVFDAFTGSGSTAISCIKTERSFVGSEMGDDEFGMAVRRISANL